LIKRGSGKNFDRNGSIAGSGEVDKKLLKKLLSHPYLRKKPPKTTGREEFGGAVLEKIWEEGGRRRLPLKDLVATATQYTARTIVDAYKRFIFPKWQISEVVIGGGGARNKTLLRNAQGILYTYTYFNFRRSRPELRCN
jgi:anhydro-N-acetylmuramic acid kinase